MSEIWGFDIDTILSVIAIIISVAGFVLNKSYDSLMYGPKCRIVVFSIERGLEIQLENVGSRIMHVRRVSYTTERPSINSKRDNRKYQANLSAFFNSIPCETKSESRIAEAEYLFPNSKHKMLRITFDSQDKLLAAWRIISDMTVKVEYAGIIKKYFPTKTELRIAYEIFMDALRNEDGSLRQLKAFKDLDEKSNR